MKKLISIILCLAIFVSGTSVVMADDASIKQYMHSNYSKALSLSGRINFNGYCAACVVYQLMAAGVITHNVIGHGKDAYRNYSSMTKTSGGWYTISYPSSAYSMEYVLKAANSDSDALRYYPIVLGFSKGTESSAGQTYGHAMMIYTVRNGVVYFTDSTMPILADNIYSLSIADFCKRYSDKPETPTSEFVYDGAVQFYNSVPDAVDIRVESVDPTTSEAVFGFSSPATTQYCMALFKDNVRLDTYFTGANTLKIGLSGPGAYSAYVSACNLAGYTDSYTVSFNIGNAPENGSLSSNKYTVSAGEQFTLFYGADYATSYAMGITYPDISFEAVHLDGSEMYITSFDKPGIYKIYVSCCNASGYVDTEPVTICVQ